MVKANPSGGIGCFSSDPTIINCTLAGNGCSGITCTVSEPTIANCLIYGNTSAQGAGINLLESQARIVNCVIYNNTAGIGGGIYCAVKPDSTISNCIIRGNTPEQILADEGMPQVTYSNVQGGCPGPGNIDADPLLADPGNGDFHLTGGSPCIDAADNTAVPAWLSIDLDGHPRYIDDPLTTDTGNGTPPIVDMGAYEFQPCIGDLDGDGEIGLSDLIVLLANYGTTSGANYQDGDLDLDGDVDLNDLALLLSVYGTNCE